MISTVLAVDPGGTTGFTLWTGGDSVQAWMDDDQLHALDKAYDYISAGHLDALVCESFIIGAGTIKKSRDGSNTAIEMIGTLRWLCYRYRIPFVLQAPSDVSFVDDVKLKRIGWYTPGPDHARSSTRHLATFLLAHRLLDRARLLP